MRILIDARLYGLENAGLGRYLINLIDQLGRIDSKNEYVILLRKKYFDSLKLPDNWKKVLADFPHYGLAEQLKLPALINGINPDIVHFPHFNAPVFYKGKYVVTIHDMLMHKSVGLAATTLPAPLYFLKRLGYRFVFDNAIQRSKRIIVPSETVKKELTGTYNIPADKVSVTYEGVSLENISFKTVPSQQPYFIYAGNAYPHKNLKRLIEAVLLLNKNIAQPVKVFIASSRGIFTQRLEKTIKELDAGLFVKLIGFVNDEQLFNFYKNSQGFVFASLSEGFGLPGLEAMASGTLVLSSDIPVFREIYQGNAVYFNPADAESIKDAMENVLKMKPLERAERISKAKDFVKRYSWAKMAEETLRVYSGIL
jgi:glycosyltransferase involved in cell wall biosynthesis